MAIFGIGADFSGESMVQFFLDNQIAGIGYNYEDAPAIHRLLNGIKMGDIIYIKSHPPQIGLIIKAVGIVRRPDVLPNEHGFGIDADWVWHGPEIRLGQIDDRYNVRNNTLYEEFNPEICNRVIDLLICNQMNN